MNLDDRMAICDVIARYSHTYDAKDAEAFAALFLDDAVFEVVAPGELAPIVRLSSRRAIRDWASHRHQVTGAGQARHYQVGTLFDALTPDTASTRTMLLLTRQGATDATPTPVLTGIYRDQWRKTVAGWRLAHRLALVDRDPGLAKHWA